MPYKDGTGPEGSGPGTGRGAGFCSGYAAAGGRRMGYRGHGRGHRFPTVRPATEADELSYLKSVLARANDNARAIRERIEVLESAPGNTGTE